MRCPVCEHRSLRQVALLQNLMGFRCDGCSGVWIDRGRYETWRSGKSTCMPTTDPVAAADVEDIHKAKICPQCEHLLFPYRVGHGVDFRIDYCGACGGVWCDNNEWKALCDKQLHTTLHDVVSDRWQADLRRTDFQQAVEASFEKRLGGAYPKAVELRNWLSEQPEKQWILAYLQNTLNKA